MLLRIPEEQQGFKQGEETLHEGNVDKGHGTSVGRRKGGKHLRKKCELWFEGIDGQLHDIKVHLR